MISGASSSSSAATTTVTVINSNSNSNSASITSPSVEPSTYLSKNCILSTSTTNHLHPHKRLRRSNNDDDDEYDSHDDEPGWNITNEMKARLQQSSWLRKELQDGGLRQLIDNIDAASDSMNDEEHGNEDRQQSRERSHWNKQEKKRNNVNSKNATKISARELALARTKHTHPKFASFTDQLLLLAGVLQPAAGGGGGGGEFTMSDTGLNEGDNNHGHFVLAPIPRLNRTVLKSSGSGTEEEEEEVEDGSNNSGSSDEDSEDSSSSSSSSSEEKGDGDERNDSTE